MGMVVEDKPTELSCINVIILCCTSGKGGNRIGNWNCSEGSSNCQIWAKELHDGSYAIALYNAVS